MSLLIIAVGKKMPDWVNIGFNKYQKRFSPPVLLKEIRPEPRANGGTKSLSLLLDKERQRIEAVIPKKSVRLVLDERGQVMTTLEFSAFLQHFLQKNAQLTWIIGGPDGVHPQIKNSADALVCLSSFTLPHGLARLLLIEQLYRAFSVLNHHPYHRD